jgi:multiple sugar transport system substrate-binding protein
MKKISWARRVFPAAALAVCFCALASLPVFAAGKSDQSGITTIRVWTDSASDKVVREQQIARFNEGEGKQKGIKIEYTVYGTNYHEVIRNAVLADTAPEVFRSTGEDIFQFQAAGKLVALEDLPGGKDIVGRYNAGDLQKNLQVFGGKTYSLPYSMTTFKLIINKTMFDAAGITADKYPKTWADVRAVAKQLTNKDKGQYGFITGLQSPWVMRSYLTMPNGQNTGNTGFNNGTLQFEFSKSRAAVEAVYGMVQDGSVFPGFEGLDADMMRARFADGSIGMIMGASFDCGVYNNQFPAKCDWLPIDPPTDAAGAPKYRAFVDASNLLTIGLAAKKNADKAMEVYKFFYSDENLAELYVAGLYVPFRQEAIKLAKGEPSAKGFKEFASVPNPAIAPATPENRIQVEGTAYRETLQKIFARGYTEPVAQVLADLDKRYNDAVGRLSKDAQEDFRATVDFTRK